MSNPHWSVTVCMNGENLVTIETTCLSGKPEFTDEEAQIIRDAAAHLEAFIGKPAEPAPPADRPWNEQELWLLDWHTKTGDPRFQDAAMALRGARQPADRPDTPPLEERLRRAAETNQRISEADLRANAPRSAAGDVMRTRLCAELGTAHHGDVQVALQMIAAAAEACCDAVKIQHYGAVNPRDPQAQWLDQSRLHVDAIASLCKYAKANGLEFWATPFDAVSLRDLRALGVDRLKIASSEAHAAWWGEYDNAPLVISWPWGEQAGVWPASAVHLTAIPLYPTPLECVTRAMSLDGWSDHVVGLSACYKAISLGATWIEAHLRVPGLTREWDWEKTPADFRALRQFADDVETMRTGVGQVFRDRWTA